MKTTALLLTPFLFLLPVGSPTANAASRPHLQGNEVAFHLPQGNERWEFPNGKVFNRIGGHLQEWGTKKWEDRYERLASQARENPEKFEIYLEWASRLVLDATLQERSGGGCRREILKEAGRAARELKEVMPTLYWNDLLASLLHSVNGRKKEAEAAIREAVGKAPDSSYVDWARGEVLQDASGLEGQEGPLVWSLKARLALQKENLDLADTVLNKWIRKQPDNVAAWNLKGQVALARKDLKAAREVLAKIKRLKRPDCESEPLAAAIARSDQDYPTAIRTLKELIQKEPSPDKKVATLLELSDLYREAGDPDHAEGTLKIAFDLKPQDSKIHYAMGHFYLRDRHDSRKAIFHFREYLARTPPSKETGRLTALVDQLEAEGMQASEGNSYSVGGTP